VARFLISAAACFSSSESELDSLEDSCFCLTGGAVVALGFGLGGDFFVLVSDSSSEVSLSDSESSVSLPALDFFAAGAVGPSRLIFRLGGTLLLYCVKTCVKETFVLPGLNCFLKFSARFESTDSR